MFEIAEVANGTRVDNWTEHQGVNRYLTVLRVPVFGQHFD
jgi:hypothetical protein